MAPVRFERLRPVVLCLFFCLPLLSVAGRAQETAAGAAEPNRLLALQPAPAPDETERVLRAARDANPRDVRAAVGLADIARTQMRYAEAFAVLRRLIPPDAPAAEAPPDALNALGALHFAAEDFSRAEAAYRRLQDRAPDDPRAALGLAQVALARQRYPECKRAVHDLLSRHPDFALAHALLAQIHIEENQPAEAARSAERAVALAPNNPETLAVLCSVRIMEKKPEAVRALAQKILALNPYHVRVRRILSQYVRSQKSRPVASPAAQRAFRDGLAAARRRDHPRAVAAYAAATEQDPAFLQALLGLGAAALDGGLPDQAERAAERAVRLDPDNPLAHLQLSLAHLERHERARRELGVADADSDAPATDAPATDAPPELGEVFVASDALSPAQRRTLWRSVAPFARFLPELKRRGAKHYLLALDQQLADVPAYAGLADHITFDGRFYGSIRGVGGVVTVSGIEHLAAVDRGGFNTIAHEFAHQVHACALDAKTLARIQALYAAARRAGKTLDYYAAANEMEYFAQGYEAYVSRRKRPNLGPTGRHTRDELLRVDPDLHRLIDELARPPAAPASASGR